MGRKRHTHRERLLVTGSLLLVLLVAGIFVTGRIINRRAGQMSDHIVIQISEYHCQLLQAEFDRTEELLQASADFLREHSEPSETELHVLTRTLLRVDPKAGCIWFAECGGSSIRRYPRKGESETEPFRDTLHMLPAKNPTHQATRSFVINDHGKRIWTLACAVTDAAGKPRICGIDYPLPELHAYMSGLNPRSRSSAMLLDPNGVIVYHPDTLKLGLQTPDSLEIAAFRTVTETGRRLVTNVFSDYLGVDEQRIYYPIRLAGQRWVAGIGIPRLIIEQEIDDFHFYTVLTAVIAVLLFAALLIVAQRRWRREYTLRKLSEQESAQLQLQQLLEQIDPHFLFNSLNSLYALIRCNPEQAREFTLTLARVYRRVLERRKQILSTLAEEIEFTGQYYSLQKIRFGESLELSTAIDPALRNRRIPSMSLQTLVENAVKHNRISAREPLHIRIRTEGESILIENNCTPRDNDSSESLGVGLERIRSVYRFHTDENISTSIDDGMFKCRMPLLPAEE